ncbi:hypothetical protein ABEV34_06765 [Methylorubrum rhodesianum]|uniref:hypothetical protein n=1 Tax=Methylorubrum TaxID=2282523 RepID=UPI001611010B|nr:MULTISPECIES: hypothetical protein [Methylorubrum]MBB5765705.1 hypothetical protein [Methylorubrum rhodesianum]MBI1691526.1 hypothetical protein [Methylorubrum sp. DB1722]
MSNDQLRLVATVDDRFTGPLAKLRKGLHDVSAETKAQAGAWKKDWDGAREGVSKFEGVLRGVTPVLSGLGVAGIGVGLSIAGAASAIGEFSSKTRGLSQTAKDIGLTIDQLRTFNALGERFGVTADTMTSAAKSFAGQMFEIKRQGSTFIELQAMNLGKLAEDLASSKNMEQAIQRGMEGLRKIPDAEVRRRVSRLLFGTDDVGLIASNVTGTVAGTMKEVSAAIGKMDKDTEEAAKNFQKHMNHISEAAERAKLKFIGPLLEGMVGVIDDIENAAKNPEAAKLKMLRDSRADADKAAKGAPWPLKGYFERQRDSIDAEIRKLEDATRKGTREGLKDALRDQQNGGATFQQQSYGGGPAGGGSLIHKAAWSGFGGGGGPLGGALGGYGYGAGTGGGGVASAGVPTGGGFGGAGPLAGRGSGGPLDHPAAPAGTESGSPARAGQFTSASPEAAGKYRPQRTLTDRDLSDAVVNTIAGEARLKSPGGADAVINNMFNRLGTKGWGPSRDLHDVARAPGQYEGYRRATEAEATFIRDRIRAIASGGVPDNTNGANSFRASWYRGPWYRRHGHKGKDIAGNTFAFDPSIPNGPYAPYPSPRSDTAVAEQGGGQDGEGDREVPWHQRPRSNEPGKMSRLRDDEIDVRGSGERPGDRMMRRFYGEGASVARGGKGSLHITLDGFPPGAKARASMDDLFKETRVERSRSQMDMI